MISDSIYAAFMRAMRPPGSSTYAVLADNELPRLTGSGSLPAAFPVTELAAASIGAAASALGRYMELRFALQPRISVDRRLASMWFAMSLRPMGWQLPSVRDPVTGDYAASDGWIRLHANAPHHRAAVLAVLGCPPAHDSVAQTIAGWRAFELEDAIVAAGGCAAAMRSRTAWEKHPQGLALQTEPLFHYAGGDSGPAGHAAAGPERPLAGIKVLDLTRVLAGPVSTRYLAGYGAQVLRIDPPFWTEPGMVPEVTLGKRCAQMDLRASGQLKRLKSLMAGADILIHGYRADALERLGLDPSARQRIRPGLVDVCLDAYGWTGPWSRRRGFDSLVQMSCGIAEAGMRHFDASRPAPLPVQALDQATGYLMAAAALDGLAIRWQEGRGSCTRLSLARTADLLMSQAASAPATLEPESENDWADALELTQWGPARRLKPPCDVEGAAMRWDHPASALGSSSANWL
jgi:hypothetical protein